MRQLEHLVPPPIVLLFTLIIMFVISRFDQVRVLRADNFLINNMVATGLVIIGAAIVIMGIQEFKRTKTTVNPLRPETASNLVTSGIFRITRNPMYLGMLLIAFSSVAYYGSAWCLIAVAAFRGYINRFQIKPEERAMEKLFGQRFATYKSKTRRWL